MDTRRDSRSETRVHKELLRGHVETGFSLAHLAETAIDSGDLRDVERTLREARFAVSEGKRLLSSATEPSDDYWSELQLLEFELNDLETRIQK
jgi:hypothetical protein